MKKWFAAAMAVFFLLTASGCAVRDSDAPRFRIVTSFYPMYIMALNIANGIDGVQIDNMAGQQAGCLHDYQLQSKDMKNLESADVFVINGAGMESFLEEVTAQLPDLEVLDSSEGIELISEGGDENPHVWVSITDCIQQVENIAEGLAQADPDHALEYLENAQEYEAKLSVLRGKMHEELDDLPNRDIVTFHEAFPYFAQEFNLRIVQVVNREPDSQPSAKEMADTIRLIRETGVKAVFAEPQYPESAANVIAEESGASFYFLDPAVTGENDPNAYLDAMEKNLETLKEALS